MQIVAMCPKSQRTIDIDNSEKQITIFDNGVGMSQKEVNDKYLMVGYAKRIKGERNTTNIHNRPFMGRKGIGKLSVFSIAKTVKVFTNNGKERSALKMNSDDIEKEISKPENTIYYPTPISTDTIDWTRGTKLILSDFKKSTLAQTTRSLKKRLARRFSIIGSNYKFRVFIDGDEVTVEDRDYFHKIEYLFSYGDKKSKYKNLSRNSTFNEARPNKIEYKTFEGETKAVSISGWIGLSKESGDLQDGEDNLNKISLIVRGKLAKEDLVEGLREGGLYTKYLFGELRADFFDDDDKNDIATSSRQDVKNTDERFIALRACLNLRTPC